MIDRYYYSRLKAEEQATLVQPTDFDLLHIDDTNDYTELDETAKAEQDAMLALRLKEKSERVKEEKKMKRLEQDERRESLKRGGVHMLLPRKAFRSSLLKSHILSLSKQSEATGPEIGTKGFRTSSNLTPSRHAFHRSRGGMGTIDDSFRYPVGQAPPKASVLGEKRQAADLSSYSSGVGYPSVPPKADRQRGPATDSLRPIAAKRPAVDSLLPKTEIGRSKTGQTPISNNLNTTRSNAFKVVNEVDRDRTLERKRKK
jgi:hypothetical protein